MSNGIYFVVDTAQTGSIGEPVAAVRGLGIQIRLDVMTYHLANKTAHAVTNKHNGSVLQSVTNRLILLYYHDVSYRSIVFSVASKVMNEARCEVGDCIRDRRRLRT